MTWVDRFTVFLDLLLLVLVIRSTRDVKSILSEARHERLDINRRLEVLSRRVDRQYQADAGQAERETGDIAA